MTYLEHFHFDNIPFPTDDSFSYLYPRKKHLKIISEITNGCRFYNGVFLITGNKGVGKSVLINLIINTIKNNEVVVFIKANEKSNIIKSIAEQIGAENHKNIESVFAKLQNLYCEGKNTILVIDDAHNLTTEQLVNLFSLIKVIPSLKVILSGRNSIKKNLKSKSLTGFKKYILKTYKIRHLSFIEGMKYVLYISNSALALSQYKKVISWPALILLSFVSNRNIHNINYIATDSFKNAFNERKNKVCFKDVYNASKNNFDFVKENLYLKFQKIFFYLVLLLSIYFVVKIVVDRYDLIINMKATKSIRIQEREIQNNLF